MTLEMPFQSIKPYVRYVGNREIKAHRIGRWMAARDNRIFLCLSGGGTMGILDNKEQITIDDIIYLPAGTPYYFMEDFMPETVLVSINFDFVYNEGLGKYQVGTVSTSSESIEAITRYEISDCNMLNTYFITKASDQVKELIHQIQNEYFYQKLFYSAILSGYLTQAIIHIVRGNMIKSTTKANFSSTIDRLIDYIKQNFEKQLDLEAIADYMGYHPDYINRLMHQHTGKTIYQYLLEYRIDKAAQMIRSTELPFSEIAEQTGFSNASHFSHSFKKFTGKTPSEFRKID